MTSGLAIKAGVFAGLMILSLSAVIQQAFSSGAIGTR